VPFPTRDPETADAYTSIVSHELVEAITDPEPGQGWVDKATGKEIADLCENLDAPFHGYKVSSFWALSTNSCGVPPDDGRRMPGPTAQIVLKAGGSCLGDAIEGEALILSATATRRGGPDVISSYVWVARSVDYLSSPTSAQFSIRAPSPAVPFLVELNAVDELGCTLRTKRTIQTISAQEAVSQANLCALIARIRQTAIVNFHPNPLWDPLRDFGITPVTGAEIRNLRRFGHQLIQLAERAEKLGRLAGIGR
jgi:hypothetical protein